MTDPWTSQPVFDGREVQLRLMQIVDGPAIVETAGYGRLFDPRQ